MKNKYFITAALFVLWMIFFDRNDLFSQFRLQGQLRDLEKEKLYYQDKIEEVKDVEEDLFTDDETLERFARERYLMKKDNEDIFVIVEQED